MNVLPKLQFLNAITAFTPLMGFLIKSFATNKSIYMGPIQGLNLKRRYISGLEPEMPVAIVTSRSVDPTVNVTRLAPATPMLPLYKRGTEFHNW
jgi:hypothetical protein